MCIQICRLQWRLSHPERACQMPRAEKPFPHLSRSLGRPAGSDHMEVVSWVSRRPQQLAEPVSGLMYPPAGSIRPLLLY